MNAGRELDALVAEKVMGWEIFAGIPISDKRKLTVWLSPEGHPEDVPHFSTDIAAAWQVVERMAELARQDSSGLPPPLWWNFWNACFSEDDARNLMTDTSQYAALRICVKALESVGVNVELEYA